MFDFNIKNKRKKKIKEKHKKEKDKKEGKNVFTGKRILRKRKLGKIEERNEDKIVTIV